MGMRYTAFDKNRVQITIKEYEKRRKAYKERGLTGARIEKISQAIHRKRKSLKLIEEKQKEVEKLAKLVKEFTTFDLWKSTSSIRPLAILAKGLFCKYGLENGLGPTSLAWYIGAQNGTRANALRKSFQHSFAINAQNLTKWREFKAWIKQQQDETTDKDTTKIPLQNTRLSNRGKGQ